MPPGRVWLRLLSVFAEIRDLNDAALPCRFVLWKVLSCSGGGVVTFCCARFAAAAIDAAVASRSCCTRFTSRDRQHPATWVEAAMRPFAQPDADNPLDLSRHSVQPDLMALPYSPGMALPYSGGLSGLVVLVENNTGGGEGLTAGACACVVLVGNSTGGGVGSTGVPGARATGAGSSNLRAARRPPSEDSRRILSLLSGLHKFCPFSAEAVLLRRVSCLVAPNQRTSSNPSARTAGRSACCRDAIHLALVLHVSRENGHFFIPPCYTSAGRCA